MTRLFDLTASADALTLEGAHRLEFLNRMSTNEVASLADGRAVLTALTTPLGRMVDCPLVICLPGHVLMLVGAGNAGRVTRWLRKYIFFNDDVRIGAGPAVAVAAVCEADAPPPAAIAWPGGWLLVGDSAPGQAEDATAFEAYRIARGWPRFPNEIGEDYIPLESGLRVAVSFTKGCYIGQEIIARMESRGQIAKRLMRLAMVGPGEPGEALRLDGATVGTLTSRANAAALGYVRAAQAVPGVALTTVSGGSAAVLGPAGY